MIYMRTEINEINDVVGKLHSIEQEGKKTVLKEDEEQIREEYLLC